MISGRPRSFNRGDELQSAMAVSKLMAIAVTVLTLDLANKFFVLPTNFENEKTRSENWALLCVGVPTEFRYQLSDM